MFESFRSSKPKPPAYTIDLRPWVECEDFDQCRDGVIRTIRDSDWYIEHHHPRVRLLLATLEQISNPAVFFTVLGYVTPFTKGDNVKIITDDDDL